MKHRNITGSVLIGLMILVLMVSGCATTDPYHSMPWTDGNCLDADSSNCKQSYYQEHSKYDLAFAEFTERGNAFNDDWIKQVLAKIGERQRTQGVVTMVFIHGWKYNADENDENLKDFKKTLELLAESAQLINRRLVGVYIGWRGSSIKLPLLKELTFWDRKAVAQEVGKGGVTRLLLELDKIDRENKRNVLAIVGHSFGGAITVSATSEVLTEIIVNDRQEHGGRIGDAVIVLNPAIEANQTLSMVEAAVDNQNTSLRNPLFYSISSDADSATHYLFPIGQTIGLLFTWRQKDLQRSYYYDRLTDEKLVLREEHLDAATTGNFAPYLTHRLTMNRSGDTPYPSLLPCDEVPDDCAPKGLTTLDGHPTIGPLPADYPLQFIKTDTTVMAGHNDIFNPRILTFIYTLIDDVVRYAVIDDPDYKYDGIASGNILSRPEDLKQRFGRFYDKILNKMQYTPAD
ncbi:MAG: hypothetical protein JAY75_20655 [Candidatus Thiodiazotropha taylori]|nr:hypothetical protein [Candidatus Thiodiazotropha taylori]MCW4224017.1 hypothetical protein [Candidatus Thiodiazotropha endolucinida]MCG7885594.1 hypothetical protein [Candidatus Thiodiazotropha taylori]MCG7889599.1 hypothetical protein [Candidatus Thiodiazotropha taylori]MCG8033331.1 hypothetical protein [Candidatus Thiodiazotropha taylori]